MFNKSREITARLDAITNDIQDLKYIYIWDNNGIYGRKKEHKLNDIVVDLHKHLEELNIQINGSRMSYGNGLKEDVYRLETEISVIKKENEKLKALLNEVIDYVYREEK